VPILLRSGISHSYKGYSYLYITPGGIVLTEFRSLDYSHSDTSQITDIFFGDL